MTAKQWLNRARNVDREIDVLIKAKERERDRLLSITANITGETVSRTKDPHRMDNYAALVEMLDAKTDELYAVKTEVAAAISKLTDRRHREVLYGRYILCRTWEQIAVDMSYSYMQVTRLHGAALDAIKDVIECYT